LVTIAIGLVIGFEIINTAIEYVVDIVSFEYSVKAKKVKDVAAAATLFMTLVSIVIGLLVFLPAISTFMGG
jgi:diacylglycerol kinase